VAWNEQRNKRLEVEKYLRDAQEELADRLPMLKGEIALAYLDIGKYYHINRMMMDYEEYCVATIYLHVVNHSNQDAFVVLPPILKLEISGREYTGDYVNPTPNALRVNDSTPKGDGCIYDLFGFGTVAGSGVFQKPRLHHGWLMFNIPGSQVHLGSMEHIAGSVSITLKDTLGGSHLIDIPQIEFRLNKIGFTLR
jgi:hypothetical protein